jgi:nitrite reductase (NADH) small subunit
MTAVPAGLAETGWTTVCPVASLTQDRGMTALVGGAAVAVFCLTGGDIRALAARDPFCDANVLGRGLVGSAGEISYVASPMYKHRFDLATGCCLDDPAVSVPVYRTRVVNGVLQVGAHARSSLKGNSRPRNGGTSP